MINFRTFMYDSTKEQDIIMSDGIQIRNRIKFVLSEFPKGVGITELSHQVNMHRNVVAKYLEILRATGDVEMRMIGMSKVYTISHRLPVSKMYNFQDESIIFTDNTGKILKINEAYRNLCRKPADQIIGIQIGESDLPFMSDSEIISYFHEKTEMQVLERSLQNSSEDTIRHFRIRIFPVSMEDGISGVAVIAKDITKEKELEEQIIAINSQYKSIIDHQPELICRFLPDYTLIFANISFREYFATPDPKQELIRFSDFFDPEEWTILKDRIHSLYQGRSPVSIKCRLFRKGNDGNRQEYDWYNWHFSPVLDNLENITEIQATGRKISHEIELENRITQYQDDITFLIQKVGEFSNFPHGKNIYEAIGDGLRSLVSDAVIMVHSFDPSTHCITIRSILGDDKGIFRKYFQDMIGLSIPINDEEVVVLMESGNLHRFPGALYICAFGKIPVYTCAKIEEALPIRAIYSIGVVSHGKLIGLANMLLKNSNSIENPDLVEAYIRLSVMAFHKQIIRDQREKCVL
jgi:PAS domain-containing protein